MCKLLLVGGDFQQSHLKGKSSSLFKKIAIPLLTNTYFRSVNYINGGNMHDITGLCIEGYDVIFWAANIPNELSKDLIKGIKIRNPKCILISTKRNLENEYTPLQIINHALNLKSNLVLEFKCYATSNNIIKMALLDPLGNCFYYGDHPQSVAEALLNRIKELKEYTRMGSVYDASMGTTFPTPDEKYLEIVRAHGKKFQSFLVGSSENSTRFLGNTSFRCIYGFPTMRAGDIIMVSKRNLDKAGIDSDSFVPVALGEDADKVVRCGTTSKPSVDTPIQLMLYRHFKNINFMLHSHVYAKEDTFWISGSPIPCGCLEEAARIIERVPADSTSFKVNLKGHGCIIAADSYEKLIDTEFYPREIPEDVEG